MALQESDAVRNASNDTRETTIGASPTLEYRTGAPPANCAAADTGTVIVSMTLPADWLTASAAGVKSKNGTWTGTSAASGQAGHWRIKAGATCHQQGTAGPQAVIATNALTAANGNVLNFASTTGVANGMNISGTGVPADTTVVAFTGTTVTMSKTTTAGVANAASITFAYDSTLANVGAAGQTVTVDSWSLTRGNA